ncbi:hypothetical protein BTVI_82206 [Pitangus sulphuratus]|nr:hypothetical protein BTVI_82206 [Pitangus sulphuratus]
MGISAKRQSIFSAGALAEALRMPVNLWRVITGSYCFNPVMRFEIFSYCLAKTFLAEMLGLWECATRLAGAMKIVDASVEHVMAPLSMDLQANLSKFTCTDLKAEPVIQNMHIFKGFLEKHLHSCGIVIHEGNGLSQRKVNEKSFHAVKKPPKPTTKPYEQDRVMEKLEKPEAVKQQRSLGCESTLLLCPGLVMIHRVKL